MWQVGLLTGHTHTVNLISLCTVILSCRLFNKSGGMTVCLKSPSEPCQSFAELSLWEEEMPFHSKRICADSRSIRWKHPTDNFKEDERERMERIQGSKMRKRCRETRKHKILTHSHFQFVFRNSSFKTVQPTHRQAVKHPATWERLLQTTFFNILYVCPCCLKGSGLFMCTSTWLDWQKLLSDQRRLCTEAEVLKAPMNLLIVNNKNVDDSDKEQRIGDLCSHQTIHNEPKVLNWVLVAAAMIFYIFHISLCGFTCSILCGEGAQFMVALPVLLWQH